MKGAKTRCSILLTNIICIWRNDSS